MPKLKLNVENLRVERFDVGAGEIHASFISLTQCYSVNAGEYCVPQPATRTCGC
jgi:hypothetical protein